MTKKRFTVRASIYDKRGRVLTTGENSYSCTHPLQAKYAVKVGLKDKVYLHAEISALSRLKRFHKPHRIVVERYKDDGSPALAKPCKICETAIKEWGIKIVDYTEGT